MRLFLEGRLAGHRRGRFLTSLLGPDGVSDTPSAPGLFMMIGKDFQFEQDDRRAVLTDWSTGPGCSLLLLPPYLEGALRPDLDWRFGFREHRPEPIGVPLPDLLVEEVTWLILGRDGDLDRAAGHRWADGSVNTRYLKAHSGSGVFAATCLPLWSIALLDEAGPISAWLGALHAHAGAAADRSPRLAPIGSARSLGKEALGLMVCLYGFGTADPERIMQRLASDPFPVVRLDRGDLAGLMSQLRGAGLVDQDGLTDAGIQALRNSPYWGFAERLATSEQ